MVIKDKKRKKFSKKIKKYINLNMIIIQQNYTS